MKSLSELTTKIREWNFMGFSLLPNLQFAIIHNQAFNQQIVSFLQALQCKDLFYHEQSDQQIPHKEGNITKQDIAKQILSQSKPQQIQKLRTKNQDISQKRKIKQLVKWDKRLQNKIYAIYIVNKKIEVRIHLIIDQDIEGKISDNDMKKIKKILQKLKRNKNLIFINCNTSVYKLDSMVDHIEQFGLGFKSRERQIRIDEKFFNQAYNFQFRENKQIKNIKQKEQKNYKLTKGQTKVIENLQIQKLNIQNQNIKNDNMKNKIQERQQNSGQDSKKNLENIRFGTLVKDQLQNMFNFKHNLNIVELLASQIHKKYVMVFGVEINRNFNQMKQYHKQLQFALKQYNKILDLQKQCQQSYQNEKIQIADQQSSDLSTFNKPKTGQLSSSHYLTKYALNCLYETKEYLVASLMGTYSTLQVEQISLQKKVKSFKYYTKTNRKKIIQSDKSIHWQVMQIINEMWDIQGDTLMKQIQKMPLSYIQQRYKMLDYQTIGGFMPSSCFQAIFSSPLHKTLEQILTNLQMIQAKIIYRVKKTIYYYFDKLNICDDFCQKQIENIRKISNMFINQTKKVLKSQISYISTSSQDYWSYKQLNSNLYTPEQQIYIQIKYIGKNYIKKVWDNIKQTLPRLIGQNLLRQVAFYLQNLSLNTLISIIRQIPLQIYIRPQQLAYLEECKQNQRKMDQLVFFFSLRTNSSTSIKNLHERMEKSWKRTFRNHQEKQKVITLDNKQSHQKKGFVAWAINLIKGNKKRKTKRSLSQQKYENINLKSPLKQQSGLIDNQNDQGKKHPHLSEKNWLLIININKQVQIQKIQRSSEEGFPQRLRPAIWHYLAMKQKDTTKIKIQSLLDLTQNFSVEQKKQIEEIYKQIEKDVLRTPPPNLFRQSLKQSITRVLRAYSLYDKSLRYTQGMNFIVGIILCVLTHYGMKSQYLDENVKTKTYYQGIQQKAFHIFIYMMQKKGLRKIMLIQRSTITDLCIRLERYIQQRSSIMSEKIERSGFTIQMIFSGALISGLTTSGVDFNIQKRVIDILITYDFSILYKVIGQFVASAESISQKLQNQNLYFFLKDKFYNQVFKQIGQQGLTRMFKNL